MKTYLRTVLILIVAAVLAACTSTDPAPTHARTIDAMKVGEVGYTMPWAMWADMDSRMWLNPKYPIGPEEGTSTMRVERHDDGFHAWPPEGEEYTPTEDPEFVGDEGLEWIPVVAAGGYRVNATPSA